MTDPDPPRPPDRNHAEEVKNKLLAARADRVQALTDRVHALEQRPASGISDELAAQIQANADDIARLAKAHRDAPPPFDWDDLEEPDLSERWDDLTWWVDNWLPAKHPQRARQIKPCWAEHPTACQAVTALWLAWCGAYRASTRRHTDPATWIKDTLPAMTDLAGTELGGSMPCPVPEHRFQPRTA